MEKKIGFIAGCFDPFPHPGHLWAMQQAINQAPSLRFLVALHDDPTIERPDTKHKPVMSLEERRLMLESLWMVDRVVTYNTEEELLEILQNEPIDVRVLGEDYKDREFTGKGLHIVFYAKRRDGWSATDFLKRIRA